MEQQTETQKRGQLTERIKKRSVELFGYEMSQVEVRLLPYIQYTLVNSQRLNPEHLNEEERKILAGFVHKGWITDGVTPEKGRPMRSEGVRLRVTKEFWNAMHEIIWLGYVDLFDEHENQDKP